MRNKFGYRHGRKRQKLGKAKDHNNRKESRGRLTFKQTVFNNFLRRIITIFHLKPLEL